MSNSQKIDLETFKLMVETVFDAGTPESLGSQITWLMVSTLEIKAAAFFVVNPAREELEVLATEGLSIEYLQKGPILVDKSIKLENNLEPVIIENVNSSGRLQYPEKAEAEGIQAIVSLPLKLKGKLIGALRLYHSDTWEISDHDLGYLQVLTKSLAMALKHFRLSAAIAATKETLDEVHPVWL